jgi:hypothetical protein
MLLQARARAHTLNRTALQTIVRSLREGARKIVEDAAEGAMSQRHAAALRKQFLGLIAEFEKLTVNTTTNSVSLTVKELVTLHQKVTAKILEKHATAAVERQLVERFDQASVRALAAIASRAKNAATFQTLARRNMKEAAPDLDRLLQQGIARGVSARQLAKDVEKILSGEFPSLQEYGLRVSDLSGLRTVRSDAMRIARSEINNAAREANRQALHQSPIVLAARWQTSGNHQIEDECDDLANADEFGFGKGFWRMDEWPVAPHPNCACYAGDVIFRPPEEWGTPKVYVDAE